MDFGSRIRPDRRRISDTSPEGDEVPGAIEQVLQAGISGHINDQWFGSLRVRYFGERPLVEDGSVKSDSSTVVIFELATLK